MSAEFDNNGGESSIMSSIIKEVSVIKEKLKSKEEDWECELTSFFFPSSVNCHKH